MRLVVAFLLIVAGLAAASSLALATSTRQAGSCSAEPPSPPLCSGSVALCENWLKGREAFRKSFPGVTHGCS